MAAVAMVRVRQPPKICSILLSTSELKVTSPETYARPRGT
jgi:hypothetical protein